MRARCTQRRPPPAGDPPELPCQQASPALQKSPLATRRRAKGQELEDSPEPAPPKPKRPRLCPVPGLSPCLQPLARAPHAVDRDAWLLRLGPYVLLEPRDGGRSYRAVHRSTEAEYSCRVYPAGSCQEALAPYGRLPPHPNVARVAEVIQGDRSAYVFFRAGHGDVHGHVRQREWLPEPEAARLFGQMAEAVARCHEHGLVLRDLKLRKFVFADRERTRLVLETLEDARVLSGPDDSLRDKRGCPAYVGPEILSSGAAYSGKAADVRSLGVALYAVLAGRYPFQGAEPTLLFSKIRHGVFSMPEGLSSRARCLLRCLLRRDPAERLTARGVLLHPGSAPRGSRAPALPARRLDQVVPDAGGPRGEEEDREEELYG
ncbi:LOW QUALITY PROTEIN: tribbles homolog 3 [Apteryx mantelli]|uniref:LOW QUALITY PROTEIN: tribbles homolog 3 n=1 Tax=Apteryx mantelli TaxID=2696672 RepID=A0ABM4FGJ4_9AVES